MPIRQLVNALKPAAPKTVQDSAARLRYRDFLTVALILDENNLFPDHWIYIHDPRVHVGRIQNYNNWSRDMIPIPGTTCLGLEYFCSEGDRLWSLSDDELIELARNELAALGLAAPERIVDGTVVRMEKAYPVYDASYRNSLSDVRNFLQQMANLQLVGRNGMHRYNNQDHSMLTAMLAAENIMGARHDIWTVNVDAVYQEQGDRITSEEIRAFSASQPRIPFPVADSREPPVICCEQ
jgi:protoporphyrinogen oxidase